MVCFWPFSACRNQLKMSLLDVGINTRDQSGQVAGGVESGRAVADGWRGLVGFAGEGGDSTTNTTSSGVKNSVSATLPASWESDLWGKVRRSIESSQATAQQSDALLAGVRLSISSSVASNYFALRQMNIDVRL